jgi:hypothetical protein
MTLEYHDGHYHDDGNSMHEQPHGMFQRTHNAWERVLEHIGGVYFRLFDARKS